MAPRETAAGGTIVGGSIELHDTKEERDDMTELEAKAGASWDTNPLGGYPCVLFS